MANPEVFVDTSGLYALVEKNEAPHAGARRAVEKLLRAGRKLVLTDYILDETVPDMSNRSTPRMSTSRTTDTGRRASLVMILNGIRAGDCKRPHLL